MYQNKKWIFVLVLSFCALFSNAQTKRQFSGRVLISPLPVAIDQADMTLEFNDDWFLVTEIRVGDIVIDNKGNSFEITALNSACIGNTAFVRVRYLDGVTSTDGIGVVYRPSEKGLALLGVDIPNNVLATAVNSALLTIDAKTSNYLSGSSLPPASGFALNDAVLNSGDNVVYKRTATGWSSVTGISTSYATDPLLAPAGTNGEVIQSDNDMNYYVYNGSWKAVPTLTSLPSVYKYGDVFYTTGDKKLYLMGNENLWVAISGTSVPAGPVSDFPTTPKAGDFFFDNVNNILYVYDALNRWVEVSINGSMPKGPMNPNPLLATVKESDLFYNTTDHKLYIYNGTAWKSITSLLGNGEIFVGNSSNVPVSVPLSGDASINNIGQLTIKNGVITNQKLDKANIPLDGFGLPMAPIKMGNGVNNFQIQNLGFPVAADDAATAGYVQMLFITPAFLGLKLNNVFVGDVNDRAFATPKVNVPISDFGRATASVSMNPLGGPYTNRITELGNPTLPQDAVPRSYVDSHRINPLYIDLAFNSILVGNASNVAQVYLKSAVSLSDFGAATADVLMGGKYLKNLHEPVSAQDAATMSYVDSKTLSLMTDYVFQGSGTNTPVGVPKTSIHLNDWGAPTSSISMSGTNLTDLADPRLTVAGLQDAASRKYVDGKVGSVVTGIIPPTGPALGYTYYNTTDKIMYVYDGSQWLPVNNILPKDQFYVGDASNKATATLKNAVPLSGFGLPVADISLGNFKIIGLADPTNDQDGATKKYVDFSVGNIISTILLPKGNMLVGDASGKAASTAKSVITLSGFGDAEANISLGTGSNNYKIINVANPTGDQDAATKYYVDSKIIAPVSIALTNNYLLVGNSSNKAIEVAKSNVSLSEFGAISSNLSLKGYQITNMAEPVTAQDAATKNYVDISLSSFSSTPALTLGYLFVGDASNKAAATVKTAIPLSGFGAAAADVDLGIHKITNLLNPTADQEAATKKYVDLQVAGAKLATIGTNTLLGNNTASTADALALTPLQVKTMLSLNNVDNTTDATKNVLSATKLTTTVKINGVDFNGSTNITIPGDNMGNHTATQNIKTVTFAINNDGVDGKGLTFDAAGDAAFAQDVTVNGNFYTPSDQRLKKNIVTLGNALQAINSMRGVRFEYKDQTRYAKGPKIGVIAQELVKVFPEMVTKGADGFYKVDYTQLSAVLIQAVNEQQKMMHQQQLEINDLKVRLDNQQLQINAILKKIE